ncbi:MAG: ABC transporter substrate-binding protein [Hyphomicrobiaceae bacterium]
MKRREFITLLGGVAAASPLAARAQQAGPMRRVGILIPYPEHDALYQKYVRVLREELARLGWTAGSNVLFDERWTTDNMDRVWGGAVQLLDLKPDVIVVWSHRATSVLHQQASPIPVVFVGVGDPVETGLVTSLAKPGGSLTGFTVLENSVVGKMLEMLKQISPGMNRAALIFNPENPTAVVIPGWFEAAAVALTVRATLAPVHAPDEIERAVESFSREPNGALLFLPDATVSIHREFITALVARHRLPAIYGNAAIAASGGLMSYGTDIVDLWQRAGSYVDRILRGEKPGDLPVQQPTKYGLVINLKTAEALGLTVPATLLARADEVIE